MKKIILLFILACSISVFSQNISNPQQILTKIDTYILDNFPQISDIIDSPPDCTVIRIFKEEKECEIWAKNASQDTLSLITTLQICSMDFSPGPKLRQGDGKTPEGFYYGDFSYYSKNWFMWMDLNNVNQSGEVGKGSAFRICLNYPNRIDQRHTEIAGFNNTGGAICVHGNCVSIGCVSFRNNDFLLVYAFSRYHNSSKYGKIQFHIFPFRFSEKTEVEINELSNRFIHLKSYSSDKLRRFWKNLKFGDNLFNNHKMPLSIITNRTYLQENDLSEIVPTFKQFLNKMGYFTGEINSIFGYDLRSAVIQYQTLRHLTADGVIGNKTINKMREDGLGEVSIEYIYNDN
jgi:murein L,D-transpeptidase YafK